MPDSDQVPREMALFLDWFNQPSKVDGIVRAAVAHLWFEAIHPFETGNGRIERAIIDMAIAGDIALQLGTKKHKQHVAIAFVV